MSELSSVYKHSSKAFFQKLDLYYLLFNRLPGLYRPQDALLHLIPAGVLLASIAALIINKFIHQFTVVNIPMGLFTAIPGVFIVWIFGTILYPRLPRFALFLSGIAQMYFYIIISGIAISALLTTSFPLIDQRLLNIDNAIGFSTLKLLSWTNQHSWLYSLLQHTYDCWFFELTLTPLVLAWLNNRAEIDRYVLATFISFIIAGLIYYFWPTVAPAGILKSVYFTQDQHDLVQRFFEVHHSLPVTVFDGGLISFPSCHVINSLVVLYAWRRYWWLFYPLILINIFLIFATMGLGYHYLTDVLLGFVIAYISVKFASYLLTRVIN